MLDIAGKNKVFVLLALAVMASAITGSVLKKNNYIFASQEWGYYSVVANDNPVPDPDLIKTSPRLLYAKYKANRNDTFNSVAAVFGTDVRTLKGSNISMLPSVHSGDVLNVLNRSGLLYACSANDTLYSLSKKFLPKNASLDSFRQEIVNENLLPPSALIADYVFQEGESIFFPGVFVSPEKKFVQAANKPKYANANKLYVYPLRYKRISSRFGYRSHPTKKKAIFHKGCDFQAPLGTPVYAARAGIVKVSGWERGYGNTVEIIHPDGYITRYAHLSKINVKKGDSVVQGKSKIGEVGKSGIATGYHLHFELITPKGKVTDPLPNIKKSTK